MAPSTPVAQTETESVSKLSGKKTKRPTYRRRDKPPFTFAELITMAIKESSSSMLTLREILEHLAATYECFRGSYVGWKNSVRHNLTINDCFTKVLKDKTKPNAKDNYWALNPDCKAAPPRSASAAVFVSSATPTPPQTIASAPAATGAQTRPASPVPAAAPNAGNQTTSPTSTATLYQDAELKHSGSSAAGGFPDDEWKSLQDLYIPDEDIDLSLYNVDWPSSINTHPNVQQTFGQILTGNNPCSTQTGFRQDPSFLSAYSAVPRCGSLLSNDSVSLPGRMRIEPEYRPATSRYHPYTNVHYTRREPRRSAVARCTDCCRDAPCFLRTNPIIVPAIRNSLGLDFDEMALSAIDRSVRVLDVIRPCDHLSA